MKYFVLILLMALLLAGCGEKPLPTEPTLETTVPPEPTGIYAPDSVVEQKTDGAVRVYPLEKDSYFGLYTMGSHLLVVGEEEMLTLSGDDGELVVVDTGLPSDTAVDAITTGMSYYLPDSREVVVRNPQLQIITHIHLPDNMEQMPLISMKRDEIFYSTGSEIRALHMETGISRMIRQLTTADQTLLGSFFDGSVLACRITEGQGRSYTAYFSADSGQMLSDGGALSGLQTFGETYFVNWFDGAVYRDVFGTRGGEVKHFATPGSVGENVNWKAALEMNGIVRCEETKKGLQLTFYDFETGKMTASEHIPGVGKPDAIHCDGKFIWILAQDEDASKQILYRWDIKQSAVNENAVYTGTLYTAENPDAQGLADCRTLADAIETEFGVSIAIWQDGTKNTNGHTVVAEHHPKLTEKALLSLREALGNLPEGFLGDTIASGKMRINLVQSIEGEQQFAHFWDDGVFCILISSRIEALQGFYQGLGYAIDSHVLGNSRDFDTWNQLNPQGFAYSYTSEPQELQYLEGENKAFASLLAMTYPNADRSETFCQAMLANNGEMFSSETMQKKLYRLCIGIREAYGWEKSGETFLWEQYLNESLAYVKK